MQYLRSKGPPIIIALAPSSLLGAYPVNIQTIRVLNRHFGLKRKSRVDQPLFALKTNTDNSGGR